jgi:Arc/MetJ-type ribon-helix-helix transcriptional regulator
MRESTTFTVSLPPAMAKEIERAMKAEHRTRSELVREALRVYLSARLIPAELPTAAEVRAYRSGMAAYRRGDSIYCTSMEWTVVLAGPARKSLKRAHQTTRERLESSPKLPGSAGVLRLRKCLR